MSLFRQIGLSLSISEPAWNSTGFQADLTNEISGYRHEIRALGGYWSASFSMPAGFAYIDDRWLGRHVTVRDDALVIVWEGFIDSMDIRLGGLTLTLGPLLNIANRVDLVYSTVDTTVSPPTVGLRANVGVANNTGSQTLYGIRSKVLSTGGATPTTAAYIRDAYLTENAYPQNSKQFSGSGGLGLTFNCLGYVHMLDWPYSETVTTGTRDASGKITDILGDDPNLTWNTDHVNANTLQVDAWENDDKLAFALIKEVVGHGDIGNNRWLFGVYDALRVWYHAAPTTIAYEQQLSDDQQAITEAGAQVFPWAVQPGKWLLIPDLDVGRSVVSNLTEDLRAAFLESVTYTAPWNLSWQGSQKETLPQVLAQLGLAGVGA